MNIYSVYLASTYDCPLGYEMQEEDLDDGMSQGYWVLQVREIVRPNGKLQPRTEAGESLPE